VRSEMTRMVESGLTAEELDRGRGQMRGGMVLSLEDTGSRMTRLGEVERAGETAPAAPGPPDANGARTLFVAKPTEQVHVCLGAPGIARDDDRRHALRVLDAILGGTSSSRLFQEVREKRGLAYSVFSFASQHIDAGLVGVSVGCLPSKLDQVLQVVRAELAKIAESGIDDEELTRGKGQLKGGLVLGLEDSGSRMTRLGKSELVDEELLSIDEVLARIDAVTLDDVRTLAAQLFSQPEILAVVGPR